MIYGRVTEIPDRERAFSRRRDRLHLARRGRDERRRVLGSAQRRLHQTAAGAVPRRGQRLRHLGAGRSPDARRRHLAPRPLVSGPARAIRSTAPTSSPACAPCAKRPPTCATAKGPRSCTRTSSARTRTRCPTTKSCTRRRRSAKPKRGAIRSRGSPSILRDQPRRDRRRTWPRSADVEREINDAADPRCRRRQAGEEHRASSGSIRRTSIRRPSAFETPAQPEGKARHDGGGDQPHAQGRDGAQPAHRRLRRGRRRREPEGRAGDRVRAKAASSR